MTTKFDFTEGAQFDPGFIRHLNAFIPSIEYIYSDLNSFKNFNQKKLRFKMYYRKLQNLIDTYTGFYLGCILWAACIKDLDKPVLNNLCYGGEYDEKETVGEVQFVKKYIKQFTNDSKYYLGQDYKAKIIQEKILDEYEDFLMLNKGFVNVQKALDIKLNSCVKILSSSDKEIILDKIAEVIESGEFKELYPLNEKLFTLTVSV